MNQTLTLGTAKVLTTADGFLVQFMNTGSFLIGEQIYGHAGAALRFCRERNLRVIECR